MTNWEPTHWLAAMLIIGATIYLSVAVWKKPIRRENTVRIIVFVGLIFASMFIVVLGAGFSEKAAPIWALFGGIAGFMARGFGGDAAPNRDGETD